MRKRLTRVLVTLEDPSGSKPTKVESIDLWPGQTFHKEIGYDCIREHGTILKVFDWAAGYTLKYEYIYV